MTLNNVSITATVPTSGYAPGQVISLQIDVNNKSNKNILEFKVELNKVSFDNHKWEMKKGTHLWQFVFLFPKGFCLHWHNSQAK